MRNLKLFASHSQFIEPTDKPAVSYCEQENEVHYHPDPFNGHEYVDLGLPSGTLWAKCNVGANSETDYGLYFAWGETQGYPNASTKAFRWSDYKFNPSGDGSTFTKYNTTDNKVVLEAEDDAATVNMGGSWHMPTNEQYEELLNTTYVTNTWVTNYQGSGINGCLLTSVSNGNTLFIPASANYSNGRVVGVGYFFRVWSSSRAGRVDWAYSFFCSSQPQTRNDSRNLGCTVRGVIGQMNETTSVLEK